jgi:hypothetical protein
VRDRPEPEPHDSDTLDPVPVIEIVVALPDATLTLSDGRLLVTRDPNVSMMVPIESIRRIQFDVEKRIPASIVIVPENALDEPQLLKVPAEFLGDVATIVAAVGARLAQLDEGSR